MQKIFPLMARDKDLDRLYEKIYEDNALGKISDERFKKLAEKHEEEQRSIAECIAELKEKFDEATSRVANTDRFLAAVRKYTKIKKPMPRILAELIDHIEVNQAETVPGGQMQKIVIVYNSSVQLRFRTQYNPKREIPVIRCRVKAKQPAPAK